MGIPTTLRALIIVVALLGLGLPTATAGTRTAFLVIAPDRGFLGNEEVREVFEDFATSVDDAQLAFVTQERAEENLRNVWKSLPTEGQIARVVVLPLFLSKHDALYKKAQGVLDAFGGPLVSFGIPLGASYLAEEILFDRVEALASSHVGNEQLVVITAGANSSTAESALGMPDTYCAG